MKKALIAALLMTIEGGAYAGTAAEQLFKWDAPALEVSAPKAERSVEDPVTVAEGYKKLKKMFAEGEALTLMQLPDGKRDGWMFSPGGIAATSISFEKTTVSVSGAGPLMPNLITGLCDITIKTGSVFEFVAKNTDLLSSSFYLIEKAHAPYSVELNVDIRKNGKYLVLKIRTLKSEEAEEYAYLAE